METWQHLARMALRVLRSRLFAAAALVIASVAMITTVTLNMQAVTVTDGDQSRVVLTFTKDPHAVLAQAGVQLSEADTVRQSLSGYGGEIAITRAMDVQVTADGITTMVRMASGTVEDALEKVGVSVGEHDTLNVGKANNLSDGMNIVVARVQYREYTKTQTIAYESVKKYTNTIVKGKTRISQKGQNGVRSLLYREEIVDGKVVETTLVKETVTKKAVNEIKLVGTVTGTPMSPAPFDIELDDKGHPVHYKTVYTGKATAYTNEGGRLSQTTASGLKAAVGVVGVNPKKIPYGTKLYIVSPTGSYVYGYAIAGDTGSGCRSNALITDLFMDTYVECIQFGRRTMMVYVLE